MLCSLECVQLDNPHLAMWFVSTMAACRICVWRVAGTLTTPEKQLLHTATSAEYSCSYVQLQMHKLHIAGGGPPLPAPNTSSIA